MDGKPFVGSEFQMMSNRIALWDMQNPNAKPRERLRFLLAQYEKHNWGVSSRDLALGKSVDYVKDGDKYLKVESDVRGYFYCNPNTKGDLPECHVERTRFKLANGKRMSEKEYLIDSRREQDGRNFKLTYTITPDVHTTGEQTDVSSKSVMESAIPTGFGSTSGIITPVYMNMLMELMSFHAFMTPFVTVQPMPSMSFYFPIKLTKVESDPDYQLASKPTPEGRAGMSGYEIDWTKWEVNGWKYLRHFELTDEISELMGQFLPVTQKYIEDMGIGMAMLWDYSIVEGMQQMLLSGYWRYPKYTAGTPGDYAWVVNEKEIPWGKASVLTTNAKYNYLFQDLSGGTYDGKIYYPGSTTGDEFEYQTSGYARLQTTTADDLIEGILALGTLLKNKGSTLEYVILTDSLQTERLFRDANMRNLQIRTGDLKFQDATGYLGKLAIGGSVSYVDLWEAPVGHIPSRATTDAAPITVYPIIGGKYGMAWNQGIFSPLTMRIDEGFEAVADAGSVARLRPTQSKVTTASSKGSSWPGDYHHLVILWTSNTTRLSA